MLEETDRANGALRSNRPTFFLPPSPWHLAGIAAESADKKAFREAATNEPASQPASQAEPAGSE